MKKTILIVSLLVSSLSFASVCPNLSGIYSNGSTDYSIKQKNSMDKVLFQFTVNDEAREPMIANSSNSRLAPALGGKVTQRVFCQDQKLVYQELMMGLVAETQYSLDQEGDFVISEANHMVNQKPLKVTSKVFKRIQ